MNELVIAFFHILLLNYQTINSQFFCHIRFAMGIDIFINYAEEDETFCRELQKKLTVLKNMDKKYSIIKIHHKGFISPGSDIRKAISHYLEISRIILLLFSWDFLNNAFEQPFKEDFSQAIRKHEDGTATVIPIIVKTCPWQDSFFKDLGPLPSNRIALNKWPDIDEAYMDIYNGLKRVIDDIIDENDVTQENDPKIIKLNRRKGDTSNDHINRFLSNLIIFDPLYLPFVEKQSLGVATKH